MSTLNLFCSCFLGIVLLLAHGFSGVEASGASPETNNRALVEQKETVPAWVQSDLYAAFAASIALEFLGLEEGSSKVKKADSTLEGELSRLSRAKVQGGLDRRDDSFRSERPGLRRSSIDEKDRVRNRLLALREERLKSVEDWIRTGVVSVASENNPYEGRPIRFSGGLNADHLMENLLLFPIYITGEAIMGSLNALLAPYNYYRKRSRHPEKLSARSWRALPRYLARGRRLKGVRHLLREFNHKPLCEILLD